MKWLLPLSLAAILMLVPQLAADEPSAQDAKQPQPFTQPPRLVDEFSQELLLADVWQNDWCCALFMGIECPLAKLYVERFESLAQDFNDRGVDFVLVNANLQDTPRELQQFREQRNLRLPILKDLHYDLTDAWQATRTPEVILVSRDGTIAYRGRIDDQYRIGQLRAEVTRHDLREALNDALSGQSVRVQQTELQGCLIGRPHRSEQESTLTFANDIAPILNRHCLECHRSGDIGPMSFEDADEVVGWADMILEVIEDNRMPPWHAENPPGTFLNERRMSPDEKQTIANWVAAGTPLGSLDDRPPLPAFAERWRMDEPPDIVIPMADAPFRVPSQGVIDYQYYVVDPGWTTDHWVRATQVLPGDSSVVHHTIVFIRAPNVESFEGLSPLGGYVPGQTPMQLEPGQARRVPAGSKLVFQMHYTPVGREVEDLTRLGIWLADADSVREEVVTGLLLNQKFLIPPGAAEHPVRADLSGFPPGTRLLSLTPHMHYRGKSFRIWLQDESASPRESLLDVPRYDFNWQHIYRLANQRILNPESKLSFEATFDNSPNNPLNPDPTIAVQWGEQSWEEMAIAFIDLAIPRGQTPVWERDGSRGPLADQAQVDAFMKRFDTNQDGWIQRNETTETFSVFVFSQFDKNNDERLSRDELLEITR